MDFRRQYLLVFPDNMTDHCGGKLLGDGGDVEEGTVSGGDLRTNTYSSISISVNHLHVKYGSISISVNHLHSRGQDVIPWDLLAEIDFFVLSYSLTLS